MSCILRGVLRTGEKSGGNKKRVHFSDEFLGPVSNIGGKSLCAGGSAPEYELDGAATTDTSKSCRVEETAADVVEVFAKASISCDANSDTTATSFRQEKTCLAEEEKGSSSADTPKKATGSIARDAKDSISFNSPCTPPSCGSYGLATWDIDIKSDHSRAQVKGVQRELTFVVGARDQTSRKRGSTSKKSLSKAQNYKIVPESDGAFAADFLTPHLNVMPTFGFPSERACKKRCAWITPHSDAAYVAYHDEEWGIPVHEDRRLFELLVFAGAQSEIAWSSILTKREAYRDYFSQFDPTILATYDMAKMTSIKSQRDIMKSETRMQSIVSNAKVVIKIVQEFGSFDEYLWRFVSYKPIVSKYKQAKNIPMRTAKSEAISKDLQRRGMRHAGPMVIYSFMQAAGLANDHLISCFRHCSNSSSSSLLSLPPPTKSLVSPLCC